MLSKGMVADLSKHSKDELSQLKSLEVCSSSGSFQPQAYSNSLR
jgi:hypothetical protein